MAETIEQTVSDPYEPRMVTFSRRQQRLLRTHVTSTTTDEALWIIMDREYELYERNDSLRHPTGVNVTEWANPLEIMVHNYQLLCIQGIRTHFALPPNLYNL